jgi:hypothetical protein
MFQIAAGVHVPNQWKLSEGFEIVTDTADYLKAKANISLEHLDPFYRAAVRTLAEPVFIILEAPCNEVKEIELRAGDDAPFHRDVFYSELSTQDDVLELYSRYSDLLLNDGFIRFGAASRDTKQEIFVAAYKIVHFFGPKPNRFRDLLAGFEIAQVDRLVTAWELFTNEEPGTKSRYRNETGDIYDMIERLMRTEKIFFSKTIEE